MKKNIGIFLLLILILSVVFLSNSNSLFSFCSLNFKNSDKNFNLYKINEYLYCYNGSVFEIFDGKEKNTKYYTKTLNEIKNKLDQKIQIYVMIIPTHVEFLLSAKHKENLNVSSQKENMDCIFSNLSNEIKKVNIYSEMAQNFKEYLFFNTDHHWTVNGAYCAYKEFFKVADLSKPILDKNKLKKNKIEKFLGSFYKIAKNQKLKNFIDYIEYYDIPGDYDIEIYHRKTTDKPLKTTSIYSEYNVESYNIFCWGDNSLMKIKNKNLTKGRKIMILKDSYVNAFIPFIAPSYSEIYVVDPRYFCEKTLKKIIKENQIKEILIAHSIIFANSGYFPKKILDML